MKKIYTIILLCLCVFFMIACKNSVDGGDSSSPKTQSSQSSESNEQEELINSEESVENSENPDLGGDWTGIHSK